MDSMIFICFCLIIIVMCILGIVGFIYFSNTSDNEMDISNNNAIDASTTNMIDVTLPVPSTPPYNTNILILAPKGFETKISKIIIVDKNNNLVIPKKSYIIKPNEFYFLNGTKRSNPSGQYMVIFEPSIIKTISISGNLKDNILYLRGNKNDFGIGATNKLTDSYTQVIDYKI